MYVPAPETGVGLVCRSCGRAKGQPAPLGGDYQRNWRRTDGAGYTCDADPTVSRPDPDTDRLLTVSEVAAMLDVAPHAVRAWDQSGELVPARRSLHGNRLYRRSQIDKSTVRDLAATWKRSRDDRSTPSASLLTTTDAAALLHVPPKTVRTWADRGLLHPTSRTPAGHRLFARADVEALTSNGIAFGLETIGAVADSAGIASSTLRDLANKGLVPSRTDGATLTRRFDRAAVHRALERLDLLGAPGNPIVSIREVADRTGLGQAKIRSLADAGTIPTAGRIGGKRRFRLADALDAIAALDR